MAKFIHVDAKRVKAASRKLRTLINKDQELKKELVENNAADAKVKKKRDQEFKMQKGGQK
jgi:hypothetical protein